MGLRTTELDNARTDLETRTRELDNAQRNLGAANEILTNIGAAFTTAGLVLPADLTATVTALLEWQGNVRRELTGLIQDFQIARTGLGYVNRMGCTRRLEDLENKYR